MDNCNTTELTSAEYLALRAVANGADVWSYDIAMALRGVQKKAPKLVSIVKAKERPPGHMPQPYFGAVATDAGRALLEG